MKLEHRTVLITGGTSGIGLELARQLVARANTVLVTGRDQDRLAAAARAVPGLHTFECDAGDPQAIVALHEAVVSRFPGLDILINNAGIMRNLRLAEPRSLVDATHEIDIDLSGPIRMVQQFLAHLCTRPGAVIVNVSSGLAFVPLAVAPIYCAAKAGLHSYTLSLRIQLEGSGVTVVELAPPGVETKLFRGEFAEETRGQKPMSVEELARRALEGMEAGRLEIRPGLANVLKAMSRIAPAFMAGQMAKMAKPK